MTLHVNRSGTWTDVQRPYVKRSGVWAPVKEAWVKRSGTWERAYEYDTIPSSSPELSLVVVDGRYINVQTRLPDVSHDPDLAMIRVLVGPDKDHYPSSQYSSVYISGADSNYPYEPWSDLYYNGYKVGTTRDHDDSSLPITKQYPLNPTSTTDLAGGRYYRFSAWSMDLNGNWSAATSASIWMPSTGDTDLVTKHAQFAPIAGGNIANNVYADEPMVVKSGQDAIYFYGGAMAESMGQNAPVVNITGASLMVYRKNDSGESMANVYVFYHNRDTAGWTGSDSIHAATYVGQIAKGQAKWFTLPAAIVSALEAETARGLGFYWKNPTAATSAPADYMEIYKPGDETGSIISGNLNLVWTESP